MIILLLHQCHCRIAIKTYPKKEEEKTRFSISWTQSPKSWGLLKYYGFIVVKFKLLKYPFNSKQKPLVTHQNWENISWPMRPWRLMVIEPKYNGLKHFNIVKFWIIIHFSFCLISSRLWCLMEIELKYDGLKRFNIVKLWMIHFSFCLISWYGAIKWIKRDFDFFFWFISSRIICLVWYWNSWIPRKTLTFV